jgi:periplasmic protein TonB
VGPISIRGRSAFERGAPLAASIVLHVALVAVAAVAVPRASARWLDAIPVELVVVETPRAPEPPRVVPEPVKRVTPPKPIVTPRPKLEPMPTPTPPPAAARTPEPEAPAPPAAAPIIPSPAPVAAAAPSVTLPTASPAPAASMGSGVSLVENLPAPARSGSTVAALPPDAGVTRVAQPRGGYQVQPSYPSSAKKLNIQGTTMLRVHVLADGKIGEINVEQSAGHPDLDQAATDAVRRWRFEPARRGDDPVAMWVELPVVFRLR